MFVSPLEDTRQQFLIEPWDMSGYVNKNVHAKFISENFEFLYPPENSWDILEQNSVYYEIKLVSPMLASLKLDGYEEGICITPYGNNSNEILVGLISELKKTKKAIKDAIVSFNVNHQLENYAQCPRHASNIEHPRKKQALCRRKQALNGVIGHHLL